MEPEKTGLTENWEETKKALISGLTPKTALMNTLLENQRKFMLEMEKQEMEQVNLVPMTREEEADEIIRRLKTPPPKPDPFNGIRNVIMPMIRRIIPGTIANEITSVQPMTAPTGLVYTLNYKYGTKETTPPEDEGRGS